MSSQESLASAVKGAHTVFVVTNFWESRSAAIELAQGKAVTDACKVAGVQHLIFSSLLNITDISQGRLPNISHFDGKADIEKYIRQSGVPATFVLPGMFMSGFISMFRKNDDGVYALTLPVSGETAKIPLLDAGADMGKYFPLPGFTRSSDSNNSEGKFVKAAIKSYPSLLGQHIYAANNYLTPAEAVSQFSEVIGKPAVFQQLPNEVYKSFLPAPVAQELLENMLLFGDAGYYGGADLTASLNLVDEKPTSWKEYVEKSKAKLL